MTFASRLAQRHPEQVAIKCGDASLTWQQADQVLRRLTNRLLELDLGPSRRVAVFAGNSAEAVLAYGAITLAGGSAVPVNFHLTAAEAAYLLADSGAAAVFVDAGTLERGRAAAAQAGVPTVIAWGPVPGDIPTGVLSWQDWLAGAPDDEPTTALPPHPSLVYTSGTTGRPKGTELPPTSFVGGADIAEHLERLTGNSLAGYGRHLVVGPMYHSGPLVGTRLFLAGVPITVLPRFDAEAVLAAIDTDRIGSAVMVPAHFQRILDLPEETKSRYDLSSLRFVLQVGAKCPARVKQAMIDWWGPVLWESYGASEVGTVCQISAADWMTHRGSVGKPVPPFEVIVVDDDGAPVPTGVTGRLYFRDGTGRGVVYHNTAAADAHLEPGVFTLGEIGYADADGFVYVTDRFSDMVVSGGVNIYPAESEQVLAGHPGIAEVACIGIPDPKMGEQVLALVVRKDPALSQAHVLEYCRDRLTHYKCPRSVEFVDTLERNAVGKINKRALRAPYWERSAAQ
jgi:long-chain acyl-CoA synthetase